MTTKVNKKQEDRSRKKKVKQSPKQQIKVVISWEGFDKLAIFKIPAKLIVAILACIVMLAVVLGTSPEVAAQLALIIQLTDFIHRST